MVFGDLFSPVNWSFGHSRNPTPLPLQGKRGRTKRVYLDLANGRAIHNSELDDD